MYRLRTSHHYEYACAGDQMYDNLFKTNYYNAYTCDKYEDMCDGMHFCVETEFPW